MMSITILVEMPFSCLQNDQVSSKELRRRCSGDKITNGLLSKELLSPPHPDITPLRSTKFEPSLSIFFISRHSNLVHKVSKRSRMSNLSRISLRSNLCTKIISCWGKRILKMNSEIIWSFIFACAHSRYNLSCKIDPK